MRSATKKKIGKDPDYLEYIRSFPCCVCERLEVDQDSITESAHVGSRGMSQKCPDRETLPLCAEHHREGQFSQHSMGKLFWPHFDLDREELLRGYQARYAAELLGVLNPLEVVGIL